MVPFWDMLNHVSPEGASVALRHDPERARLEMVAVRAVRAGEEVFNTYGPLGNAELLRRYGFVEKVRAATAPGGVSSHSGPPVFDSAPPLQLHCSCSRTRHSALVRSRIEPGTARSF